MDVLTERALSVDPRGEPEGLVQLLEHLGAKRQEGALELHSAVNKRGPRLRRQLKRCADLLNQQMSSGRSLENMDDARAEVEAQVCKLVKKVQNSPPLDRDTLHPYRRQLKKLRYVLKTGKQADQQPFVATLGEVTDSIGEWHDWETLLGIAQEVLDRKDHGKIISELHEIADAKYGHALTTTNRMRANYLHAGENRAGVGTAALLMA